MDLNLAGSKKKHRENKKYSIITLDLFKPTKNSYPEFDYEQICKQYLNEDESSGEDERFHDREAEMLCKRLEEKYGGKRDKKGRRIRLGTPDDFMDKSAGYDLSDPFIDDSEAYDEHVPSTMDTMKGGFYVNKGKLEFRPKYPLDSDSEDEQATVKKRTTEKRRRVLSDDEEEAASTSKPCTSKSNGEGFKKGDVSGSESTIETSSESLRLSAAGAPPSSSKGEGIANRRLLAQQLIKRRRLIGQPPSSKIASSASPTVKAAMGVKKKLKPQVKKTTVEGSADELAVFLKDMAGGEEIPLDNLEEGMDVLVKEVSRESPKASRSPSVTSVTDSEAVNEKELPDEEKKDERAREASAPSSTPVSPTKRPIGRPPVSATYSLSKPMPAMSDKLSCMIETFKQKTREYGAPTKKIRIPPSLVDLCIRIEEQCSAEGFNHHQKTRVFDMLSNWVSVQRNSLYIRMKAFKDRRAIQQQLMTPENGVAAAHAGTASVVALCSSSSEGPDDLETKSSFISVSGQPTPATQNVIKEMESVLTEGAVESGELLKAAKTSANGTTVTTAESSSTPKTAQRLAQDVTPKAAGEVSANSALREVTQAAEGVKPNNTPVSASSSAAGSLTKIRTGHSATGALASAQKTPMSNAKGESSASLTKQGSSLKTPLSSSAKSSPPQNPLASLAAANPQMLQLLSAMLQQQSQGTNDPQQQQQNLAAGLAALQMNAAMMAANQQTEAIAQYQLALNNLAKLSVVAPQQQQQVKVQKKLVSSSAKGGVVKQKKALLSTPLSAPSVTRLMPSTMAERMASLSVINSAKAEKAVSRNESAKQRQAAVPPATASSSCSASVVNMPPKQSPMSHYDLFGSNAAPFCGVNAAPYKKVQIPSIMQKAIGVAISYSDNEYEIEKKRAERDGLPLPQKRFRWIERVRSSLKQLVTVLFFNLEMQCPNAEDVYSTVVQYLHGNVLPYFKGRISFEELMAETVRLVPDRTQLRTCPRMASLIKTKTTDIKQSEPSSANTPHAASSLSADSQKAPSEHSKASSESKPVPQLKPASQSKMQAQDGVRSQLEGDVNPQPLAQDNSEPKLANSANNIDESQACNVSNLIH
ncbi:unnamed protein product [Toxocara canis]|uniref:HUN domain-containing protein n=1 Tax=Toxocara canis TaxID=6265 RepID=A0A183UHV0_TOXCA|nr:unnamed protein product [Toxocara canis]